MADIDDLEQRINAALDRIGSGLEVLTRSPVDDATDDTTQGDDAGNGGPDPEEVARVAELQASHDAALRELEVLHEALEAERDTGANLADQLAELRERSERSDGSASSARGHLDRLQDQLAQSEKQMQRLRGANEKLRENNRKLREINATMVGDPHLINVSMLSELDSLRATRDADVAEMDAILSEMKPLVGGA